MRKVEQFELMRRDFEREGLSVRAIAGKYGVHRRKVREAIELSVPPERKVPARACPVLTVGVKDFVEAILTNDKKAPRKQRHTAHRIWQRVRDELGGAVAESTVRTYVAERRRELGIGQRVFVPQHHRIGAQAEADFYEADFDFPWGRETAQVIALQPASRNQHPGAQPARATRARGGNGDPARPSGLAGETGHPEHHRW